MKIQIRCGTEGRRLLVKDSSINAIDYLEVIREVNRNPLLLVRCFKNVNLDEKNVLIEGGVRIKNISARWAVSASDAVNILNKNNPTAKEQIIKNDLQGIDIESLDEKEKTLIIATDKDGDFSTYTLRLVKGDNTELPPDNFDPILSQIDFTFKVQCELEFDCRQEQRCPPEVLEEPVIDYMAKDYASFRRLMLDRISAIMPEWKERNVADMGIMLVELLAYIGDHLSYYQDAVATEAYLGTARKRISVKRHARLLDYFMHEGSNARTWVCFEVDEDNDNKIIPAKTKLLTGTGDAVSEEDFMQLLSEAEPFETMYQITLYNSHNEILFYTWGDSDCCLPKGATSATLRNDGNKFDLYVFNWDKVPGEDDDKLKEFLINNFALDWIEGLEFEKNDKVISISDGVHTLSIELDTSYAIMEVDNRIIHKFTLKGKDVYTLSLKVGDVLIFEEVRSPTTGDMQSANILHRHAVRLLDLDPKIDLLTNTPVVDISWSEEDALPFPLCLWEVGDEKKPVSVARGNVVLAEHGYTFTESLGTSPEKGKFYPHLSRNPLAYKGPFNPSSSAYKAIHYDVREALPDIYLEEEEGKERELWEPKRDLLASDKFAHEFVVEVDNDGTAYIRFGDDKLGKKPLSKHIFYATYRVGNGTRGNVGAETIKRIVGSKTFVKGITVRNPMSASNGTEPEDLEKVKLYAPEAFKTQKRAVTESDYEEVLKMHPEVQKATAIIRWTGSWYTVFVVIDRFGGKEVDESFKNDIINFLNEYRLAGYDLEINGPIYVPLEIKMSVCIDPNYFKENIKERLLEIFSNQILTDGNKGFFHPDNFTFGQPVYLSKIYEAAMSIPGIHSVSIEKFKRLNRAENEIETGVIKMEHLEIARLDNDPNFPENGKIEFIVEGGL